MSRPLPSVDRLRELFHLDAETGVLTWRVERRTGRGRGRLCIPAGTPAGTINDSGYWITCVDYRDVRNHRIVFAMTHGRWPDGQIDHINGVRHDNRPSNLREVEEKQNRWNSAKHKRTASGMKGVYRNHNKWTAKIMKDRVVYRLGNFDTPEEAQAAHREAAQRLHGEFARVS